MYIIACGNPVDGLRFFGNTDGDAFETHEEALQAAERYLRGDADPWFIVELMDITQ